MDKKTKKKPWMKFRHRVVRIIAGGVLAGYSRWKYGITVEKFKEQGDRAYLVLYNHQTPFDQFFVGLAFHGPVYYLATEDIFSLGWVSSLIRWLVAPIPIKKQTMDLGAIRNCIQVAKEGGTIALAPEGNRTYSGKTEYMSPAIATLAKKIGLPIAIYRLEGGYGVEPRWSDTVRKGKMRAYVSRVVEPEEYKQMTNDELFSVIEKELYVDEAVADARFLSEVRAEYLERAIYVCPDCGLSEFESNGNEIECKKCHKKIHYGEDKSLSGVDFAFRFPFVSQWYDYQKEYVNSLDLREFAENPVFEDIANISEVIVYKKKKPLCSDVRMRLYGDRVTVEEGSDKEMVFPFDDVAAMSVLGRNKLNIYYREKVYQIKGGKRFNALKYVNFYFRYRNILKGDSDGKFLGL